MSRRDLRRRVDALERKVHPKPIPSAVLILPNHLWDAGKEAKRAWIREERKRCGRLTGGIVLMPEWDDQFGKESRQSQDGVHRD